MNHGGMKTPAARVLRKFLPGLEAKPVEDNELI
jgi:hypothetical protein